MPDAVCPMTVVVRWSGAALSIGPFDRKDVV